MFKERVFLSKGIFEKDFMQTKATTHSMSFREKLLGFALGPGFVLVYTTMVTTLREMFYMSVIPIDKLFGSGTYMTLSTSTTVLGVVFGLLVAYVSERTVSRAGRFRPYALVGTFLMIACGIGMFTSPFPNGTPAQLVWLYGVNILYLAVGTSLFGLRYSVVSVCSRNVKERNFMTSMRSSIEGMIPGIFVSMIVTGYLYYAFLVNDTVGTYWRLFIFIPAIVAIPAALIEYFYTRERITEENRATNRKADKEIVRISMLKQFRCLLTNKYYLLAMVVMIAVLLSTYLQGFNSRTYYAQWILGANEQNGLAILYQTIALQPVAWGAVIVPILSRKFGSRIIMMVSSVVTLIGIGICMIDPYNFGVACGGGFVFSFGIVAVTNMNSIFGQQANDDIEYKYGFRPEGTVSAAVIGMVYTALLSPFTALYETVLFNRGFDAYAVSQSIPVNNWIIFAYYGSYAILAVVVFVVLIFFNMEKRLPMIHAELKERRKQAVLSRGEEWVDEDEKERRALEESKRIAEENRIADLRDTCAKKGLDFHTENEKYLAKLAAKKTKAAAKSAKKATK